MKAFNPNKELRNKKIFTKKNVIITSTVSFAIALVIGYSFAYFNMDEQTYTIIDSVVGNFEKVSNGDVIISVLVDGVKQDDFPSRSSGKVYESISCTNGSIATWDSSNWALVLTAKGPDVCTVSFIEEPEYAAISIEKLVDNWSEGNTAGNLVTIAEDEDGNVRYIGSNPNNYVLFNGEEWRIIGVFDIKKSTSSNAEKRIKLIRSTSLGNYSWDSSASGVNGGWGVNEWSQADLMMELNTLYLNGQSGKCYNGYKSASTTCNFSSSGLNHGGSDLIDDAVWNTGTIDGTTIKYTYATARDWYLAERSENTGKICSSGDRCNDTVTRTTTWTIKVGLMYPSDYGYATGGGIGTYNRAWCLTSALNSWYSTNELYQTNCAKTSWLYNSSVDQWTITPVPYSSDACAVATVSTVGRVYSASTYYAYAVRPVVYLNSKVVIKDGNGTKGSPYTLELLGN